MEYYDETCQTDSNNANENSSGDTHYYNIRQVGCIRKDRHNTHIHTHTHTHTERDTDRQTDRQTHTHTHTHTNTSFQHCFLHIHVGFGWGVPVLCKGE